MRQKLSAKQKLGIFRRAEAGGNVVDICRQAGISRALFYKLRSRYQSHMAWKPASRRVSAKNQKLILSIVGKHPEYSSLKISKVLPKDHDGKSLVSNHGVQNVLARLDLSTFEKRREYSGGRRHIP